MAPSRVATATVVEETQSAFDGDGGIVVEGTFVSRGVDESRD